MAYDLISDNIKKQYKDKNDFEAAFAGTSNPHHESFEIEGCSCRSKDRIRFKVWLYYNYTGQDLSPYKRPRNNECIELVKINKETWLVDKVFTLENYYIERHIAAEIKLKNSLKAEDKLNKGIIKLYSAKIKDLNGEKWGFIDNKGNFVIKPSFDYAYDFQDNGLAIVGINNTFGIINTFGNYVAIPKYDFINQFSEGRAVATNNKKPVIIDESGRVLSTKEYDYIGNFKNGRALASGFDKEEKYIYGYLDRQGKEIIPLQYEFASDFIDGKAIVKLKDNEYALIDLNGKIYNKYNNYFVGNLGDGLLAFQEIQNGKYGYIDQKGRVIMKPEFTVATTFSEGRAIVNNSSDGNERRYGLIDKAGNYKIKPEYDDIILLDENRVRVGKAIVKEKPFIGSKYSIADIDGNFLTDFIYYDVSNYKNGLASAYDDKNTFFIDNKGRVVKNLPIVSGSGSLAFIGELIRAYVDNRIMYFDSNGRPLWKENTIIPLDNMYEIKEVKYKPNKDYLVYYPQIKGVKNPIVEKYINERLKQISQVRPIDPNIQLEHSYGRDFSVEFFKKNLLVLELNGYDYPFGAMHDMPIKTYQHIDLISGRFYELKDLFKENSNYVKILSDIIGEQIKKGIQYFYVFPDSYKGISKDQPFYADDTALYIYFQPYEIAPFAAGFPTFKIPYKEILNIINVNGEFWKSFH
ncbi:WG repeat-containing protein [Clostridium sp. PL3]|uniref:WG repeat-containing protein n=2 Tax=Clostridium thailandense TaxID=2794346 RepID=A0A949TFX4_9CLOT|nr:WG repeat-containing protein [Clostridium thailandense]